MNKTKVVIRATVIAWHVATCAMAGIAIGGGLTNMSKRIINYLDKIIDA